MSGVALLSLLAKVTGLLILGFLVEQVVRRRSAALRHGIWSAVLLAALTLPLGAGLLPTLTLQVLPRALLLDPIALQAEATGAPAGRFADPVALRSSAPPPRLQANVPPAASGSKRSPLGLFSGLSLLYALGFLGVALYFGLGLVRVDRLTRRATRLGSGDAWFETLQSVANRRLRRWTPEIRRSDRVDVPVVWGVLRPIVLVPASAEAWSEGDRRAALAHECAHVERLDWLTQQVAHAACAVFWLHPLVWLAARRLALEAERASDDRVLLAGTDAAGYAEQLYTLALSRRGRRPLAALAFARPSPLSERVDSILNPHARRSLMSRQQIVPLLLLALVSALALGTVSLAPVAEAEAVGSERADRSESSPLVRSAAAGDLEQVAALLDGGADPDHVDPRPRGAQIYPRTALAAAAQRGQLAAVSMLLHAGADVDLAPRGEATALMQAAENRHLPVVERLIRAGADVDKVMRGDGTALIAAARGGDRKIVERLLEVGADPELASWGDGTPLIAATSSGSPGAVEALVDAGANPSRSVLGDASPLIQAADRGDAEMMRRLLANGADVDAAVIGDGSALIRASAQGNVAMVELLLEAGADVNRSVRGDGSPLIAAAGNGHLETVELLLRHGADVDQVVRGDENALIQAAGNGHLDVAQLLVAHGADVNRAVLANGFEIRTPLNQAIRGGYRAVEEWLRSIGAED